MDTDRRDFLKRAALAGAAAGAAGVPLDAQPGPGAPPRPQSPAARRVLEERLLRALGDVVLPASLGERGRRGAVDAFAEWLGRYTPVAEEMHGYGYAEITYTPPDPAPGWEAQLQGLELLATRTFGGPFDQLDLPRRQEVVRTALSRTSGSRIPSNPLTAPHVALALLAHWAATPEAHDLAYGVRIGRGQCRALAETARRPLPLAPEDR